MDANTPLERFDEKYDAYSGAVYRLAMAYLGERADAEDAAQEAFLRLIYRAPRFSDAAHERHWLMRVTANLCRDMLRRAARREACALDESYPAAERDGSVLEAVLNLPEKYRGAVHLHYYEGFSVQETAKILGLSVPAVKMRLKRAREALRLELSEEDEP